MALYACIGSSTMVSHERNRLQMLCYNLFETFSNFIAALWLLVLLIPKTELTNGEHNPIRILYLSRIETAHYEDWILFRNCASYLTLWGSQ